MEYQLREMVKEDIEEIVKGEERVFGYSLGYDLIYSDFAINPYAFSEIITFILLFFIFFTSSII